MTLISLLFFLTYPSLAASQNIPPGKWWHNPRVAEKLDLNDKQIRRLDEQFRKSRLKFIKLRGEVEREQLELEVFFEKKQLNEQAVLEQYKKLEKARTAMGLERFRFFIQVRKIVGYENFLQLMILRNARTHSNRRFK